MEPVHPIEAESYRRLAGRVDLSGLTEGVRAVVARVIHASADFDYLRTMVVDEVAVAAGVAALARGAAVVTDVEMVRHGLTPSVSAHAHCYLAEVAAGPGGRPEGTAGPGGPPGRSTRCAQAMRLAAARHPVGAIFVVGCAPTALEELLELIGTGALAPALVIGVPVGLVGAAEAKAAARAAGVVCITNVGEKGGSAIAAAVVNALARLADLQPGKASRV